VLGNDTDADGDTLTAVLVSPPQHGDLTLKADGSFTYTPDPDFSGTDSFTYQASDGALTSNVATVTITVAEGPNADLAVTLHDAPDPVRRGEQLTYTATARNNGPDGAQDVALTLRLTGSAVLVAIQGVDPNDCTITYTGSSSFRTLSSLTCALGDLASGDQRTLTVTVQPTTAGTLTATAEAVADSPDDPVSTNNTVQATTTVRR